jgi:hypothetical protein
MAAPLVTSKDMMHPLADGQDMGGAVWALACTFVNIQSLAPPVALAL